MSGRLHAEAEWLVRRGGGVGDVSGLRPGLTFVDVFAGAGGLSLGLLLSGLTELSPWSRSPMRSKLFAQT